MYIGQNLRQTNPLEPEGELINIEGDWFFKISNVNNMPPFFMTIVSDANHWMFIGSNGGLLPVEKIVIKRFFLTILWTKF